MNREELDEVLHFHKLWIYGEKGGQRAILAGRDLRDLDLDLSGVDLSSADLSGANLSHTNLYGANLSGVDLSKATLIGTNLYGADLRHATFANSYLSNINLSHANLCDTVWMGATLGEGDLTGANLLHASLGHARLSRVRGIVYGTADRWLMIVYQYDGVIRVKAGCRDFTLEEARAHWSGTRDYHTSTQPDYAPRMLRWVNFLADEFERL